MDENGQREQLLSELEKEYPRLDTALIHAYAFDHDPLTNLADLRSALDEIAAVTVYDDDETFDASGTGGYVALTSTEESYEVSSANGKKSSDPTSFEGTVDRASDDTENDSAAYIEALNPLEEMNESEKVGYLMEMFKGQNKTNVEFILKKADGSFKKALDLLLNYEFLEGENLVKKGVDGFDADLIPDGYKKVKKRVKNKKYNSSIEDEDFPTLPRSPWGSPSPHPSPRPTKSTLKQPEQIIPQYKPVQLDEDTAANWNVVPPKKSRSSAPLVQSNTSGSIAELYGKASHYYGIANSRNKFGLAAAHFAEEARRKNAVLKAATAADADAMVARQSSSTHIDLHGIGISDARRIAPDKVRQWWSGLGEKRIRFRGTNGIGDGFRIVVGKGSHSAGGKSVLLPAVTKALMQEGWKMEVTAGEIYVTGKRG